MLLPDDHVHGRDEAPHLLLMYGDFECPYCQAAQGMVDRVRRRMGDDLRFAFRHYPIRKIHPLAEEAAQTAEFAAEHDRFWPMHDALYAARGRLQRRALVALARTLDLDPAALTAALDESRHADRVQRDLDSGIAAGITGTPAFFVDGELHTGSFDAQTLLAAFR